MLISYLKSLHTSQSAVTRLTGSKTSWFQRYFPFEIRQPCSTNFPLFDEPFQHLGLPLFYSNLRDLSSPSTTRNFARNISARSMAERRRSTRQLERSLAKDSEVPSIFNSWTVVKLRQELKRRGYATTGLKAELVIIYFKD